MQIKLTTNGYFINCSVLIYFIALILVNQFTSPVFSLIFYASLILCVAAGLLGHGLRISVKRLYLTVLILFTGLLNHFLVGTTRYNDQIILLVFVWTSMVFTSKELSEKTLLIAAWLNIFTVLLKFGFVGIYGQIFTSSSSNFVSVFLMYPAVLYYSLLYRKTGKVEIWTIATIWVLSLLSRGRGGIISATFFFLLLLIINYKTQMQRTRLVILSIVIILVAVLWINIDKVLLRLNNSVAMEFFISRNGLKTSRTRIISDYVEKTFSSLRNIIIGTDANITLVGSEFKGNPHNSFINVHLNNGGITLLMVVLLIIRSIYAGIKCKNPVYSVCLLSLLMRGFTDNVFWPAYGTPVFFFFLFFDEFFGMKRKKIRLSNYI